MSTAFQTYPKHLSATVINKMQVKLPALSVNEGMARATVAAFVSQLDPSVTELADIKCAVSEAVTNSIVHGYRPRRVRRSSPSRSPYWRGVPSRSRSRTRGAAFPTSKPPASRSIPPTPQASGAAWALPSWKALQTAYG